MYIHMLSASNYMTYLLDQHFSTTITPKLCTYELSITCRQKSSIYDVGYTEDTRLTVYHWFTCTHNTAYLAGKLTPRGLAITITRALTSTQSRNWALGQVWERNILSGNVKYMASASSRSGPGAVPVPGPGGTYIRTC